jgi:hypothetical protein
MKYLLLNIQQPTINQSTNQSINQSINQTINQSINQLHEGKLYIHLKAFKNLIPKNNFLKVLEFVGFDQMMDSYFLADIWLMS